MMELSFVWVCLGMIILLGVLLRIFLSENALSLLGIVLWPVAALLTWIGLKVYEHFGGTWSFL